MNEKLMAGFVVGGVAMLNLPNFQSKALDTGVPWDEMRMAFSGMVAQNMTVREKDNILLNELYGGVPPVTVSNMTSLITGGRV